MVNVARVIAAILLFALAACSGTPTLLSDPSVPEVAPADYRIGPGDTLHIFVWRNSELSINVPVRPDGKISIPLVQDVVAIGKTPMELAAEVKDKMKQYITDPDVTVIVESFVGPFSQQVRIVGEAAKPQAIAYRANMTLLDAMIQVGGLTRFAAGNRSTVVRRINGQDESFRVYLDSLINSGDIKYNASLQPGDILIIPQTYF